LVDKTGFRAVEFIRGSSSSTAALDVYVTEITAKPISKYLFGKFTEHLGQNIYHGMWAQILENPSFEPGCFFANEIGLLKESLSRTDHLFPGVKLLESFQNGVAYGWAKYGEGDVAYSVVPDCVGSWTSQRIEARSLKRGGAGIQQPVFLPLHREAEYELSLWLRGDAKGLTVAVETADEDRRRLGGEAIRDIEPKWSRCTKRFRVSTQGVERGSPVIFSLSLDKPGMVMVDHCLLFPADHIKGFDPDIVRLTRESSLTLLRYPGGNFASQYSWKDGVGPTEKRPIRLNRAWKMAEYNHMGTDEFMAFCSLVGCEPLICVNAGDGRPEEAAEWVEYCNGGSNTKYGKLRSENGHPEPYNVCFWEIGNELYGRWQMGYCGAEEYAERYGRFHKAMSKVDPEIKFIANGHDLEWDKIIAQRKGDILRSLSIHLLQGGGVPDEAPGDEVYHSLIGYTYWLRDYLEEIRGEMVKRVKEPRMAITELQIFTKRPHLPNNKTLTEALFYSGIVNTSINLGDFVEMITHSALVNHGAGLRKEREIVYADPVYYARKLYATQTGRWPTKVSIETPTFNVSELAGLPAARDVPYVDAVALLNGDRDTLSIIVSNRHPGKSIEAEICLHGFRAQEAVKTKTLNGPSYMSVNTWETPDLVKTMEDHTTIAKEEPRYVLPAHSITNLIFKKK